MRTNLVYTAPVAVSDSLGEPVKDPQVLAALADISCLQGTVLEYLDLKFPDHGELRGGYLRLALEGKRLLVRIEIDSPRALTKAELSQLREELDGQVSDGIGEGGFDFVQTATSLVIETFPSGSRQKRSLVQTTSTAWKPKSEKAESAANDRRCKAASAAAQALDQAHDERDARKKSAQPNPKNLFKLIQKGFGYPRPAGIEEAFAAEIAKLGGDLGFIASGQLPYERLHDVKLLRLLLDAGLKPNLHDKDGHSLLWLAVADAKCVTLLLDRGADVNLRNTLVYQDTALMDAASRGELKIVQLLLDRGADPHLKDFFGRSALDAAQRASGYKGAVATAKLLQETMGE